jgi:hypothetical protein
MGLPRYVWYFVLIPGLLFLIGGLISGFKVWEAERLIARTEGTVVQIETSGTLGLEFSTKVKFSTPDGKPHSFITQTDSVNAYRVGHKLKVVYDIDDPEHARIDVIKQWPWAGPIIFAIWGLILASVGGIPLYFRARKNRRADWLKLNGRSVDANLSGVLRNRDLTVNGRNPYRIGAQWTDPATGKLCQFMSDNLWTDPSPELTSRTIRVLIDPNDAKRYWMDLDFLNHRGNGGSD